jgi:hypothetical protein
MIAHSINLSDNARITPTPEGVSVMLSKVQSGRAGGMLLNIITAAGVIRE